MASVSMSMIGSGSGSGGGGCSQFPEREKEKGSRNKRKFRADPPPPLPLVPCIDCNANSDTNDSDKGFVVMNGWKMGCPSMNDSFCNNNDDVDVSISTSATHNHDHASSCYGFCNCCKAQHEHQPNSCNCSGPEEIHREPGYGYEEFSPSREQLQEEEDLEGLPEADWNEITESQLEDLLLTNLDTIYKSAIKKIAACGYTEDVTLKAVLKYGRCYGSKDILSNIIDNAMAYFSNSHDASSKDHSFEDLQQLEKYALAEMVCILREAEAETETKAEATAGAAAGTVTLNSQPRPFNRKSSELRSYSPGRAQYESFQRSHRVASSSLLQRSHSVSPQQNRLTRVRKENYDVRQRTG